MSLSQQRLFFWVSWISIYLFAWYLQSTLLIRSDVSILMHEAVKLLAGGKYLKDFYEPDPPLILFLNFVPLALMKWFSLSLMMAWRVYIFFLASVSLIISGSLVKKIMRAADGRVGLLFILAQAVIFLILPLGDFGQRDHLYFILTFPYFLLVAAYLQHEKIRHLFAFVIGLLGAIGFAIKPHYLVVWLLLEAFVLLKTKNYLSWMRVETATVVGFLFLYLISIFVFYPEYVFGMVPLVSRIYYSGLGNTWADMASYANALYCLAAMFFFWIGYRSNTQKTLSTILLIGLIGNLLAFFSQNTAWYYHILPALSMALLLSVLLFSLLVLNQYEKFYSREMILFFILLGLFLVTFAKPIWVSIIFFPYGFFGLFAVLFLSVFFLTGRGFFATVSSIAIIILFGVFFTSIAKQTDWYAHRFLLTIVLMMAVFILLVSRDQVKRFTMSAAALLGLFLFAYPFYEGNIVYNYYRFYTEKTSGLIAFLKDNAENKSVYFISTQIAAYPFIDYANVNYLSKYPLLIWVPSMVKKGMSIDEKSYYINSVADELNTQKPFLVFVDTNTFAFEKVSYDYLKNFSQTRTFNQAWRNYQYFTTLEEKPLYHFAVYKRRT